MATEVCGMGHSVKRKEDPRFIQGKGTYVDDIRLPGMVYLDIVRSPYAHARITRINAEAALALPGVLAVITGEDLEATGLAWIPTMMADKQMVLPVDTVKFQGQEVAAVVAESRYIAADAVPLVEVDYEPLPPVMDPARALEPDAPLVRPDRAHKSNHIWHWEVGQREATEQALQQSDVVVRQEIYIPRIMTSAIETDGCVAEYQAATGKLTIYMTTQAPHAIRTVFALVTGLPEHLIRIVSPDIGGGFGGKVPVYPGYVLAMVAALKLGRPVKWIEDRSENLVSGSFARDYRISAELGARKDGVLRHHALRRDGTVRDTVMYSLLAGEWPEVKAQLQYLLARPR